MPGLLICPTCLDNGKRNILGSITPEGNLEVLRYRFEHTVTIVQAPTFAVICSCGFGTVITNNSNGVVNYAIDTT